MLSTQKHSLKADLLLFITTLIATAGWIFSKEALAGLPPLLFIGTRFLSAGILLSAFSLPSLRSLTRQSLGGPIFIGTLFSLAMALWILGLAHSTHMGEGAFIFSFSVVLVPVFAWLFFREHPPLNTWLGLPISLAGFGFLLLGHGFRVEPGQVFFFGSALIFAFLYNVNSRVLRTVPARPLSAIQMLVVGGLILPVALFVEDWPNHVAMPVLGWLAASVFIATTLRYFLQLYGQSLTTPSHAAVILMLEPMLTAATAAWWYGETMSMMQLSGCLLIFVALIVSRWSMFHRLLRSVV